MVDRTSRYPSTLSRGIQTPKKGAAATYERLEDLLRDAGYKETRIFTPETERKEARGDRFLRSESLSPIGGQKDENLGPSITSFLTRLLPSHEKRFEALYVSDPNSQNPTGSRASSPSPRGKGREESDSCSTLLPEESKMPISSTLLALRHSLSTPNISRDVSRGRFGPKDSRSSTLSRPHQMRTRNHTNALFVGVTRTRAAVNLVTATSVLCRSAPPSRSTSRMRDKNLTLPPSLAKTESTNEPWDVSDGLSLASPSGQSDEEEDEIGLDTILIPPKRQRSIRSLRSHLSGGSAEARREWESLGLAWSRKPREYASNARAASGLKRAKLPLPVDWD